MLKFSTLIFLTLQRIFVSASPVSTDEILQDPFDKDHQFFVDLGKATCRLAINNNEPFQIFLVRIFDLAMVQQNYSPLEPESMIQQFKKACDCGFKSGELANENECLDQVDPTLVASIRTFRDLGYVVSGLMKEFVIDGTNLKVATEVFCDTEVQDQIFPIMSTYQPIMSFKLGRKLFNAVLHCPPVFG